MLVHPQNKKSKVALGLIFLLTIIAGIFFLHFKPDSTQKEIPAPTERTGTIEPEPELKSPSASIPPTLQLAVPFTAQASTGKWYDLHNEACEEASVIMAWAYFNNITSLPPAVVEREIQKLTEWQQTNYGYYLSITTPETARMIRDVYGLKTEITTMSQDVIKEALAEDKLVILPAQGQLLNNPNFTPPGPPYHMLVITGWDSTHFITNDPGTRNGSKYRYTYETLYDATGNYSHSTKLVNTSEKQIIIISK